MTRHVRAYIEDIVTSIDSIASFLTDVPDVGVYNQRLIVRRAVERELEIIGEAVSQLLAASLDLMIPEARKIIGMRNRIIHGYSRVDNLLVFTTAVEILPGFRASIQNLIE